MQHPIPTPELNLYNKITTTVREAGKTQERPTDEKPTTLSALQNIPEIFLPSGNKIGPLTKQERIRVTDRKDATFLVDNMLCEYSET